jgi:hypothetical protein
VYPGIDDIEQLQGSDNKKNSVANKKFKITDPYNQIPGIKESGWSTGDINVSQVHKLQSR